MRDPFSWSFPLGRLFGIKIQVHVLFPVVALGLVLHAAYKATENGVWLDATMIVALLFVSVLLHEFGHCFGARLVDGEAHEILMWPLGGLASVDVPHTWSANLLTAAAGPAVNLVLCVFSLLGLGLATQFELRPSFNPFWPPFYIDAPGLVYLPAWGGGEQFVWRLGPVVLARFFWVNYTLLLLNLLPGFPLDGGRMLQCALWPRHGFRQATVYAIYAGFVVMLVIGIFSLAANEVIALFLALFIYATCRQQLFILETGGEDSVFGYDFTQGYTSLERDQPPPRRKRLTWWQQWKKKRLEKKIQRETEQREAEERRVDELLEKIQRDGIHSLTEEEKRFLKRASDQFRNRQ